MLGANQVFMDAFYTDVRRDLAGWREERGLPADPMAAYLASGYQDRSRPTAWAARRQDGTDTMTQPDRHRSWSSGSNRLGQRPEEHQLRRRQHLRQGHRGRPGHRRGRRAALGQGLRRRPRHADRVRPGRAAAGPDARADERLPGRGARGRDGRGLRLLPARQGRSRAVDRHRHARAGGRRARRPPAPRLRHRDRDGRRRGGADQGDLRRPGRLGAVAASGLPARPRHRRDQGGQPASGRLHPRRPRHHRLGRDVARSPRPTRCGSSTPPRPTSPSTARPSRSAPRSRGTPPCPEAERRAKAAAIAPTIRGLASHGPADGRPLHRLRRGAGLPGLRRAPAAGRRWARQLPGPLPAHQGQADGARPARRPRRSRRRSPGSRSCTGPTARTTRATTTATPPRTRPRSAAPTR